MVNENERKHLSQKALVDLYYQAETTLETHRHLDDCARCREALATIGVNLDRVSEDYQREAIAGLDPYFFSRQAQTIMARLRETPAWRPWSLHRLWKPLSICAALLLVLVVGLTMYLGQRQYDRLWDQAQAVVNEIGPDPISAIEVSSATLEEESGRPGFPTEPEFQDAVEPLTDSN